MRAILTCDIFLTRLKPPLQILLPLKTSSNNKLYFVEHKAIKTKDTSQLYHSHFSQLYHSHFLFIAKCTLLINCHNICHIIYIIWFHIVSDKTRS